MAEMMQDLFVLFIRSLDEQKRDYDRGIGKHCDCCRDESRVQRFQVGKSHEQQQDHRGQHPGAKTKEKGEREIEKALIADPFLRIFGCHKWDLL